MAIKEGNIPTYSPSICTDYLESIQRDNSIDSDSINSISSGSVLVIVTFVVIAILAILVVLVVIQK